MKMIRSVLHDLFCMFLGALLFAALTAIAAEVPPFSETPFAVQLRKVFVWRTDAVVDNDIRSGNYVQGESGFRIWTDSRHNKTILEVDAIVFRPQPFEAKNSSIYPEFAVDGMNIQMENPIQVSFYYGGEFHSQTIYPAAWEVFE